MKLGSPDEADWRWLYSTEVNGDWDPVTYVPWAAGEPNNDGGEQYIIRLYASKNYDFTDANIDYPSENMCYLCEC